MKKIRLLCWVAVLMAFGTVRGDDFIWTYNPDEGLITDASQLFANSVQSQQFDVHNLIDPSDDYTNIIFHSSWSNPLPAGVYNYLQVHLNEAREEMIFTMIGSNWSSTYDTPDQMEILVSNTPEDDLSWVSVAELPDMIPAELHSVHPAFYTSPRITFGGTYTDIRFVVKATVNNRKSSSGNIHFSLARFQIYPPIFIDDPVELLKMTIDEILESDYHFATDTDPGFHDPDLVKAYEQAMRDARDAASGGDPETCRTARAALLAALDAVKEGVNPVTDGFYYIVNSDDRFENTQGEEKGMYVGDDHILSWKSFDDLDESFIFYIEKQKNGNYTIRNFSSGEYIYGKDASSTTVSMTIDPTLDQLITSKGSGRWHLSNLNNNNAYHAAGHGTGAGTGGYVTQWQNADFDFCLWYLRRINDEEYIAELIERQEQRALCNAISELSKSGREVYNSAFSFVIDTDHPLITEADDDPANSQIWSNAQSPLEGSIGALIDGDLSTYFHSRYSETESVGPHNLIVDLRDNSVSQFIFHITSRQSSYHDTPSDIRIYACNDISSDDNWVEVAHITEGVPDGSGVSYDSPGIVMNSAYRYLRFDVLRTISGRNNSATGSYFFTLSEFQIYNYDIDYENSLCYIVEGLEDACNHLIDLIDEAQFKIDEENVTQADVDELTAAIAAVRELIEGKPLIKFGYTKDLITGDYWYFNPADGLLTSEDQLYANSEHSTIFRVGRLIDPSDDYSSIIFHTSWSNPLPADVDNYLQFHFNEPHDAFVFTMVGSNWSSTYDTPDHVVFLGTNTPDDEASWKTLVELKDLIPDELHDVHPAFYTSPRISLDATYTDLRMVVKATTNNRNNRKGNIYVSLARMQFYDSREVNDQAVIDSLKKAETDAVVNPLLDSVALFYDKAMGVGAVPLILRDDQLYANSEESEQFYVGRLIDPSQDYSSIIFHTSWSNPLPAGETNYIKVHLDEPVEQFIFSMIGSNWPSTFDTPDHVIIQATHTPDDDTSWTDIIELPDLIPASEHEIHPAFYTSPVIELGGAYSDIRFMILKTVNMRKGRNGVPYVSLARFQMWGDQTMEEAPYSTVNGLKDAVDAMMAAADAVKADPSADHIAHLRACVKTVRWILINGNLEPGKEPVNIVFIGNSITYGAGLSDRGTQAPPVKCAEKVAEETGRPVFFQNCGLSGSTTLNWLPKTSLFRNASRSAGELTNNGGYLYFSMMLGTNDSAESGPTGSPVSPEDYYTNMKSIINKLYATYPDARFIVNYPIWYSPNTQNGSVYLQAGLDRLQSYHPIIEQLALDLKAEGVEIWTGNKEAYTFFVDKGEYFFSENGTHGIFYLHPNQVGAEYLGHFWAQSIIETLDGDVFIDSLPADRPVSRAVYNMQGLRIADTEHLAPGLYIVNGRKVAVIR